MRYTTDIVTATKQPRHMETHFGDREKDWECGLSAKVTKSLEMLWVKFATALLTSPHNSKGATNQTQATRHWIDRPSKFSFEKWVENYGLEWSSEWCLELLFILLRTWWFFLITHVGRGNSRSRLGMFWNNRYCP